jgi:hypothetical protein
MGFHLRKGMIQGFYWQDVLLALQDIVTRSKSGVAMTMTALTVAAVGQDLVWQLFVMIQIGGTPVGQIMCRGGRLDMAA